jgi:hypothetical protein
MSGVDGRADVRLEIVHAPLSVGLRMGDASRMRPSVPDEVVECVFLGVTCGARIGWGSAVMGQPRGAGRRNPVEVGASPAVYASMGKDGIGCFLRTMA